MANSIVIVNVSVVVAPTPATLQQTGAMISQGGTDMSPSTYGLLTQLSDLTPLLAVPAALSSLAWSGGVVTATTVAPHQLPVGQIIKIVIAGTTPAGYSGTYLCTITGSSTFTYPLTASPGSETIAGTWLNYSAVELTQMATTFFAQGRYISVYVLELGPTDPTHGVNELTAYTTANPNSNYVPGAQGYFYSYLVPRGWDANVNFLDLFQSFESPTGRTYFWVTTTLANYKQYTDLMKCALTLVESPVFDAFPQNALTAISWTGSVVTATTTTAHGVSVGSWFTIAGCTPTGYNGTWQAQVGTTAETLVYNLATNPGAETILGVLQANLYANPGITATEFTHASDWCVALNYQPSSTNPVPPFSFSFVYGVTPWPLQGSNAILAELAANATNYIATGAEGGIGNTIIFWGMTQDGQVFNYWYSIDWVQINLDIYTANAVINGSNDPLAPLYYNQQGINYLQSVASTTMGSGITFGLVLGNIVLTALDGPVLEANLQDGDYAGQTVINAVPFLTYSLENPGDYKIGKYAGLAVVYMPQNGFLHIIYNVTVTELIAF